MALIKCPECGRENVSDSAKACPGCGFQISAYFHKQEGEINTVNSLQNVENRGQETSINNVGSKKPIIILCIIVVIIFGIWYSSTRCVRKGCNERRASSGSYCAYHKSQLNNYTSSSSYNYDSRSKYDLRITNVSVHSNSASTYCTGTITNNGDKSFKFVKVKGSFKDSNGNTIETGDTYAVGSEGLASGESTSFKIYCNRNLSTRSCDVTVYDFD